MAIDTLKEAVGGKFFNFHAFSVRGCWIQIQRQRPTPEALHMYDV